MEEPGQHGTCPDSCYLAVALVSRHHRSHSVPARGDRYASLALGFEGIGSSSLFPDRVGEPSNEELMGCSAGASSCSGSISTLFRQIHTAYMAQFTQTTDNRQLTGVGRIACYTLSDKCREQIHQEDWMDETRTGSHAREPSSLFQPRPMTGTATSYLGSRDQRAQTHSADSTGHVASGF